MQFNADGPVRYAAAGILGKKNSILENEQSRKEYYVTQRTFENRGRSWKSMKYGMYVRNGKYRQECITEEFDWQGKERK